MAKRSKWLERPNDPNIPKYLRNAKMAGVGVKSGVVEQVWWKGCSNLSPWIAAFEALDKADNKQPLLQLLRSNLDLPADARFYLADLIDRQVKRKQGGQNTPAYDRSPADAMLEDADWLVRNARTDGMGLSDALKHATNFFRFVDKGAREDFYSRLAEFHANRRPSSRRMKKRRPLPRS
jgi:hypothetical protein